MSGTSCADGRAGAVEACVGAEPALVYSRVQVESILATGAGSVCLASFAGDRDIDAWIDGYAEVELESEALIAGVAGKALAIGAIFRAAVAGVGAL